MTISFYTAISGLTSGRVRAEAASHNLANVNTGGFEPLRPVSAEREPYGVDTYIALDTSPAALCPDLRGVLSEISNTDPGLETVNLILAEDCLKFNCAVIRSQDSMLGSILDIFA